MNNNFLMIVDDVFSIKDRGTIVVGKIETGEISLNENVIVSTENGPLNSTILEIEAFHKATDRAVAGTDVGLVLANIDRSQVNRGDKITK